MTDKPTDAELKAFLLDKLPASKHYIRPVIENMVAAMQAAIDKWGTLRADKIVIPTGTMEQEFQQHYRRGYEAGKKASTPHPKQTQAVAEPLTPERVKEIARGAGYDQCGIPDTERAAFINGLRHGEQAHGIKRANHENQNQRPHRRST